MNRRLFALVLLSPFLAGCDDDIRMSGGPFRAAVASADTARDSICEVVMPGAALPDDIPESSGLARSLRDPGTFWTHNDAGNEPELFAIDQSGALMGRVRVQGAELVDWEDIEAAPCGDGSCLYIGDIGDNDGDRNRVTVYRVAEPAAGATGTAPAEALHARYPDGPRDAEALFADQSGTLYVVTKGRRSGISLYRWPSTSPPGATGTLELVRELFPEPDDDQDRVTAATATPDGRWVGIRTYRTLYLYPMEGLLGQGEPDPITIDLAGLGQAQGEALAMANDGTVWLSSEADDGARPRWSRLRCPLGRQPATGR